VAEQGWWGRTRAEGDALVSGRDEIDCILRGRNDRRRFGFVLGEVIEEMEEEQILFHISFTID